MYTNIPGNNRVLLDHWSFQRETVEAAIKTPHFDFVIFFLQLSARLPSIEVVNLIFL